MEDLVDILLTTYNSNEKYLKEQLDTLLNQTHKNIKIYISDDASPNKNVLHILDEYEQKESRIKVFKQQKNLGFNANFEFLLKQSTADYIMFCDHDDIWYENKVEKSLQKIKEANCSMVYCNAKLIHENREVITENYFKYKNVPLVNGKSKLAISRCVGIGCSQIITKEVKEKMLPFKNVMAHDWIAAFVANELNGMAYIEEPLFEYRLHETNVFGGRSLKQNLDKWEKENGRTYSSFKEYRKDAIYKAYQSGAEMCKTYAKDEKDKEFIDKLLKYYESINKTKVINIHFISYFKLLGGKNLFKKMIKELVLFHFPTIAFLVYKIMV